MMVQYNTYIKGPYINPGLIIYEPGRKYYCTVPAICHTIFWHFVGAYESRLLFVYVAT